MAKARESVNLSYPHNVYRRFKEDEYLPLDERVAKINETCENRFMIANKGYADFTFDRLKLLHFVFLDCSKKRRKKGALLRSKCWSTT